MNTQDVDTKGRPLIDGVRVKVLKPLPDERGKLMELLRSDEPIFERFGQAYVTVCKPRIVKGWHYHKKQVDHFICLGGEAKVVLYDSREGSRTRGGINEFAMSWEKPILVKIPTFVIHGFTASGNKEAMILNLPTELYCYENPDEFRINPFGAEVPYQWGDVDRNLSR